jgi:hypothetical protein
MRTKVEMDSEEAEKRVRDIPFRIRPPNHRQIRGRRLNHASAGHAPLAKCDGSIPDNRESWVWRA